MWSTERRRVSTFVESHVLAAKMAAMIFEPAMTRY
jgi:hypothetical protein